MKIIFKLSKTMRPFQILKKIKNKLFKKKIKKAKKERKFCYLKNYFNFKNQVEKNKITSIIIDWIKENISATASASCNNL